MIKSIFNWFNIKNKEKVIDPWVEVEKIDFRNKNIVILTGAGISKESGIQTFRDNGVYDKNPELKYLLRPDTLKTDPEFVYNFHNDFKLLIEKSFPNAAHIALSKIGCQIITQNIDNLHERAGSKHVIHLHGDVFSSRCENCKKVFTQCFKFGDRCDCGGRLRNNVILFKESVIENEKCLRLVQICDIFIQIGSSGLVYPAAGYINTFNIFNEGLPNNTSICVDTKRPNNSYEFKHFLAGNATDVIPKLVEIIKKQSIN